jgi:SAM-dependent methyltransferase
MASLLRKLFKIEQASISGNYQMINSNYTEIGFTLRDAWKDPSIPHSQRSIVNNELKRMYKGLVPVTYQILADAVRATGSEENQIIEVGCASGYYSEVLHYLLGHPIKYIGVDYSPALIRLARHKYPNTLFTLGDATALPFESKKVDILISGCVMLHVPNYPQVISESARVSRKWVIFHRTPVTPGKTIYLTKLAYGVRCLEIVFGESELLGLFRENGLNVIKTFEIGQNSIPCTNDRGSGITYLCKFS